MKRRTEYLVETIFNGYAGEMGTRYEFVDAKTPDEAAEDRARARRRLDVVTVNVYERVASFTAELTVKVNERK